MDYKYTIKEIKVLYDKTPIKQVLKFGLKEGIITGVILGALVAAIKNKKEGK